MSLVRLLLGPEPDMSSQQRPASGALATVALSVPRVLALPNRLWTKVGLVLFKVVSPVVLALVFYVTVTPINLLLRLLGKDILGLGWKRDDSTYWIARNPPGPAPDTLKIEVADWSRIKWRSF